MEARRLAYLEALGLEALELRGASARETAPASVTVPVEPVAVASARPMAPVEAFRPAENRSPVVAASAGVVPAPAPAKARLPHPAGRLEWEPLGTAVKNCDRCGLCAGRTQAVFGSGARRARWMVIGEAPGPDEDRDGEPCSGKAGELLTAMLRACGVQREDVYVTNVLKCRPPEGHEPEAAEVAECLPYLLNQLALVQPELVICLGRAPAQYLLGTDLPLAKLRGQVHRLQAPAVPVVVTYHPGYLLRAPQDKRKAWEDLQFAMAQVAPVLAVPEP